MKIRKIYLLEVAPPFLLCATLIYIPYFFHEPSDLFSVRLTLDPAEHALAGLAICFLLAAGYFSGFGLAGRPDRPASRRVEGAPRSLLWILLLLSIMVKVVFVLAGGDAYLRGGFSEARRSVELQGIGSIIRLPLVLLPLLSLGSDGWKRSLKVSFWIVVTLDVVRAFVMSERTALAEAICLGWVLTRINGVKVRRGRVVVLVLAVLTIFYGVLELRLQEQSKFTSLARGGAETFAQSLSAYYADTTNKFYRAAAGDLSYPNVSALAPVEALIGNRNELKLNFSEYLAAQAAYSAYISTALNNPGGLAEDVSDFGLLAYPVMFIKFLLCGYALARIRSSHACCAISVLLVIATVEYPRFNYLHLPFVTYLLLLGLLLAVIVQVRIRPAAKLA